MIRYALPLAALVAAAGVAAPQEPPAKAGDRQPWQDDFEAFAKEMDKVGPRAAKLVNPRFEGKPVAWKLKFLGFRAREDKTEIEFDLAGYGVVEPKRAKGLDDPEWKRPLIMSFVPPADAVADWKGLAPGTVVTARGEFQKAFWVNLNMTRDFAIANVEKVTFDKAKK